LKIESVEAFPLRIGAKESLRGGTFSYSHYQTVLVKVGVDGVDGWGEAMTRSDPKATALLVKYLGVGIAKQEFQRAKQIWEKLWRELRIRGHTRGVDVEALSGIEISVQDAIGRLKKMPLSRLLSKTPATEVPAFAGSLFASRGPLDRQVEFAKASELKGVKVKIGFGPSEDAATLSNVRKLWADGMLVADANGAYDATTALKACSAFEPFDLAWFEEPVLSDDWEGYSSLRGAKVRIGAGESWFPGDFRRPIEEKLVGIVEPSVSRCGGLAVEVEAAKEARTQGISFSPMTGMNSAISLAASLHAASAVGSVGVEYNPFSNPLQSDLASGLEPPRRGKLRVPTRPGLGVEVDKRFVRKNSA
jgi:L-alanine-DL-glutamate epimerase-like enolase superfamily enzyme